MKNKLRAILLALAFAVGSLAGVTASVANDAAPVEAGSSCYAPSVYKSGFYYTYSSYGSGNGYHRVAVVKNGHWRYGPWKWGSGYSTITLYHGDRAGTGTCQVL